MITRVVHVTLSNWLVQLASLLFVLIHLLIATKMASDFGDATITFKIDPAFYFEMNDKVQIDAREKGKSCKRLVQHWLRDLNVHRA